jgi:hypothetical protein
MPRVALSTAALDGVSTVTVVSDPESIPSLLLRLTAMIARGVLLPAPPATGGLGGGVSKPSCWLIFLISAIRRLYKATACGLAMRNVPGGGGGGPPLLPGAAC